jgi:hypothetical protein
MWVYKNQPNSRDSIEGRRMTRPITYDIEYPLQLPDNYCNDLRTQGVYKNPPFIGSSPTMSEAAAIRAEANIKKVPISQLINNTKTRVLVRDSKKEDSMKVASVAASIAHQLAPNKIQPTSNEQEDSRPIDKMTDFIQQNKVINALGTYEGARQTVNTIFQHPNSGQAHLRSVPGSQANKWRLGIPGISDYGQLVAHIPGLNKIDPKYYHHGVTFKAPEFVNKALNKVTSAYSNQANKHRTLFKKVIPGFHAVTSTLPLIQLGSMGVDWITGKNRRREQQAMMNNNKPAPQMRQYQSSFKQDPYMGSGRGV